MSQTPPIPSYVPPPAQPAGSLGVADAEHLKVLSICYYVMAGLQALGVCGYLGWLTLMASFATPAMSRGPRQGPDAIAGLSIFACIFGCVGLLIAAQVVLNFLAAQSLQQRQRRVLILIAAGLNCLSVPLGLILGVFTFVVMSRPSVQAAFAR